MTKTKKSNVTFIAIGAHCWGRAADQETAIRKARENWYHPRIKRPKPANFSVYKMTVPDGRSTDDVYVDGMGGLTYPIGTTKEQIQKAQL